MAKKWHCKHVSSSLSGVSAKPGLYAYGDEEAILGLEVKRKYVYIGETNNLRQRLRQHMPDREQNSDLRRYMSKNIDTLKCWYVYWPESAKSRKSAEMELIKKFKPLFNKKGLPK